MAEHLQSMYRNLEARVSEKTAELEEKRERLEALYEVTTLVAQATTLEDLAQGFVQQLRRIAHADGAILRWTDESNALPRARQRGPARGDGGGRTLHPCRRLPLRRRRGRPGLRVIPIRDAGATPAAQACVRAGYATVVVVPIRLHARD